MSKQDSATPGSVHYTYGDGRQRTVKLVPEDQALKGMAERVVEVIKGYVGRRTAKLDERIMALEARIAALEGRK